MASFDNISNHIPPQINNLNMVIPILTQLFTFSLINPDESINRLFAFVKAAILIFISGCGSAILSAMEGKSGLIYNLVKS